MSICYADQCDQPAVWHAGDLMTAGWSGRLSKGLTYDHSCPEISIAKDKPVTKRTY